VNEPAHPHRLPLDPLTGFAGRAGFVERLSHARQQAEDRGRDLAVIVVDVDGFRSVNDAYGRRLGDVLLRQVAERLRECVRPAGAVARLQADRFAFVCEEIRGVTEASHIAALLLDAFQRPFTLDGHELLLTAGVGVSLTRPDVSRPDHSLADAELALARAKEAGAAQCVLLHAERVPPALAGLTLESELRGALERDELRLFYQPEVEFKTGRIIGAEALLRWQHPRHGTVLPGSFIPLAEQSDLILAIDAWVLEQACRQAVLFQQFGTTRAPFVVSVNLSAREFAQTGIVRRVARILRQTGLPPRALTLELTESTMMPAAAATVRTLRALRALGVGLALDDFGTGYSSLSYLNRFPADTIKIDQSFVADLNRTPEAEAIVHAVCRLARSLGMDVTAEGIETKEQLAVLSAVGCRKGQGHLFQPPLPADELTAILASRGA